MARKSYSTGKCFFLCYVLLHVFFVIVQFLKKSIPTPLKIIRNSKWRGVLEAKILEAKYEAKLEFPGEGGGGDLGAKQKSFCGGSMDIFWNSTLCNAAMINNNINNNKSLLRKPTVRATLIKS